MRYYSINLTNSGGAALKTYTSFSNGQSLPGALDVELDILVAPYGVPAGNSKVRIWGISLQDISQASNLNGANISVYGGMQKGLPLANPAQAGLLVKGSVFQAFGNWIGTNQTLDLILAPPTGSPAAPANLSFNWQAGQQLSSVLTNMLQTAFHGYTVQVNINSKLVQNFPEAGIYQTLTQFSQYLKRRTRAIINGSATAGTYLGVQITIKGNTIVIADGSTQPSAKMIAFTDLIGQPTWYAPDQIQVTCVMRADINAQDYVTLPNTQVTTTAASLPRGYQYNSAFQGTFFVEQLRHVGRFRLPQGEAWVTTLFCHPGQSAAASAG